MIIIYLFSDPIYIYPSINRLSCETLLQFSNHVIDTNCFGWFSSVRFVSHPSRSRYYAVPKNIKLGNQLWKAKQSRTFSKGKKMDGRAMINLWCIISHLHQMLNFCFTSYLINSSFCYDYDLKTGNIVWRSDVWNLFLLYWN